MRGMEIWISSRLEGSLAKSLSASDLNSMRIVIHSRSAVAMTNDRRLWTLGGSRFFGLSGPEADSCDLKIMSQPVTQFETERFAFEVTTDRFSVGTKQNTDPAHLRDLAADHPPLDSTFETAFQDSREFSKKNCRQSRGRINPLTRPDSRASCDRFPVLAYAACPLQAAISGPCNLCLTFHFALKTRPGKKRSIQTEVPTVILLFKHFAQGHRA